MNDLIKKIEKDIKNMKYNIEHISNKIIVKTVYLPRLAEKKLILKSLTESSQLQKEIIALRNVIFRVKMAWCHKSYIPIFLLKEMNEV